MRRSKEEAAATREAIVASAAKEFRRRGVEGIGIAELMGGLGLTHGGFYKHFASKDELVAEAVRRAQGASGAAFARRVAEVPAERRLEAIVDAYLAPRHRDHPETGCVVAALAGEAARQPGATRDALAEAHERLVRLVAAQLPQLSAAAAEQRAQVIVAGMVGALILSRLVPDKAASDNILAAAREQLARG